MYFLKSFSFRDNGGRGMLSRDIDVPITAGGKSDLPTSLCNVVSGGSSSFVPFRPDYSRPSPEVFEFRDNTIGEMRKEVAYASSELLRRLCAVYGGRHEQAARSDSDGGCSVTDRGEA